MDNKQDIGNARKYTKRYEEMSQKLTEITRNKVFEGMTVREICRKLGISTGTFYYYFDSKDDLYLVRMQSDNALLAKRLHGLLEGHTPAEQLMIFSDFYTNMNLEAGVKNLILTFRTDAKWFTLKHPLTDELQLLLENGAKQHAFSLPDEPREMTELLISMYRGSVYNWCMTSGTFDLARRIHETTVIFLHFISAVF